MIKHIALNLRIESLAHSLNTHSGQDLEGGVWSELLVLLPRIASIKVILSIKFTSERALPARIR